MANISAEQALQIPQQLKRHNPHAGQDKRAPAAESTESKSDNRLLGDETVTLQRIQRSNSFKKIDVNTYKSDLGSDASFVKETLKNKLAELSINPHTPLSISKNMFGQIELSGPLLQTDIEKIKQDLEKSDAFMQSFNRVSQEQPTLNYIDNVVKLSKAYGVENSVFNTLVSENEQFNGLNDIAHRYHALKSSEPELMAGSEEGNFNFVVN